jgi:hypothetical protein
MRAEKKLALVPKNTGGRFLVKDKAPAVGQFSVRNVTLTIVIEVQVTDVR